MIAFLPRDLGPQDGVEQDEQFAHGGDQGHLAGLAAGTQAWVASAEGGAAADRGQGGHVPGRPDLGPSAPYGAWAAVLTAVPVAWCHADPGGHFLPLELAQFRQLRQQDTGQDGPHPRYTREQGILCLPDGMALAQGLQLLVNRLDFTFQALDQTLPHHLPLRGSAMTPNPVLGFGHHEMATQGHQSPSRPGLDVRQGAAPGAG